MKKLIMVVLYILIALVVIAGAVMIFHPTFGRSPRGERLERIKQSPNYRDGSFRNLQVTPAVTSDKGIVRTFWDFLTKKGAENTVPDQPLPVVKTDLKTLDLSKNQLIWFGHSSYLMVVDGKKILVDPVLTSSFPGNLTMKPFKGTDIYSPSDLPEIDVLVITHDHYDHLDYGTVKAIKDRIGKVVCPLGVGEHLELWGVPTDKIVELDWNESAQLSDSLKFTALPARHFSGRFLNRNNTLWASYMLEADNGKQTTTLNKQSKNVQSADISSAHAQSADTQLTDANSVALPSDDINREDSITYGEDSIVVFIGGDGGYGTHFATIAERFPKIDLAILENGQYDKDWRYIHTMPAEQAQIIHTLRPSNVLSVHNSKFKLANHAWDEPLKTMDTLTATDHTFRLHRPQIGQPIPLP